MKTHTHTVLVFIEKLAEFGLREHPI